MRPFVLVALLVGAALIVPIFCATPARAAVDGTLTPPYSAEGVDYDNPPDGKFDWVFVHVGVTTNSGGEFAVLVALGGLGIGAQNVMLGAGTHQVEIPIDVGLLKASGNGPYTLQLTLETTSTAVFLGSDSFTTPPWTVADFQGPDVAIQSNVRNRPVDASVPPNGLFDFLEITVPLTVFKSATYRITLLRGGLFVVETVSALMAGNHMVGLEVTANQIRMAGSSFASGCLDVRAERIGGPRVEARCSFVLGDNATANKYELTGASLGTSVSDDGLDTDTPPDGRFDVLAVHFPITVNRSGDYSLRAILHFANGSFVDFQTNVSYLFQGRAIMTVRFSPEAILRNRNNGSYIVDFSLLDDQSTQIGQARSTTNAYSWTAFDPRPVIRAGPIQDTYLDTSSPPDGVLDEYVISIPLTVDAASVYEAYAFIDFATWQTPQGAASLLESTVIELSPGSATIQLSWPLGEFTERNVTPVQAFEAGYTVFSVDGRSHLSSSFTPSPAPIGVPLAGPDVTLRGPPAAVLLDTNHDGLFEELAFDLNLTVIRPGPFVFHASLSGMINNYPVTYATVHLTLQPGSQGVRIVFPGWAINASGLDGPYTVNVYYSRRSADPAPGLTLWGQDSIFFSSPRLLHWQFNGSREVIESGTPTSAPVPDGRIDSAEWASAVSRDLSKSDPGGLKATFLVANDRDFLYVGLDVLGDRTPDKADFAGLSFDLPVLGVPTPYSDDRITVGGLFGDGTTDARCPVVFDPGVNSGFCQSPVDTSAPDRAGFVAAQGFGSSYAPAASHRMYEFRVPLRMLHVRPGDTIGIAVSSDFGAGIYDASGSSLAWPIGGIGYWLPVDDYARLQLAASGPGPFGGGTSGIILAIGVGAAAVAIVAVAGFVVLRNRRRRRSPPA